MTKKALRAETYIWLLGRKRMAAGRKMGRAARAEEGGPGLLWADCFLLAFCRLASNAQTLGLSTHL